MTRLAASSLPGIVVGWTIHKSAPKSSTRAMTASQCLVFNPSSSPSLLSLLSPLVLLLYPSLALPFLRCRCVCSGMSPLSAFHCSLVSADFDQVLDGMASGTFVYIAAVDLIVEEMSVAYNATAKFFSIVGGFFTFVILSSHSH